jgi:hypothetical protein
MIKLQPATEDRVKGWLGWVRRRCGRMVSAATARVHRGAKHLARGESDQSRLKLHGASPD